MTGAIEVPIGELAVRESDRDRGSEILISVIVLVSERPEPLAEIYEEYSAPLRNSGRSYEFLFVSEPWFKRLAEPLEDLVDRGEPIRVLHMGQAAGETALLKLGLSHSRGRIILTLPSYRRIEASGVEGLISAVEQGADLATARRWPRSDPWVNRLQTRLFHSTLAGFAKGKLHDVACGVRAIKREVFDEIALYGDFFRFLPLLAITEGFRVVEVNAPQHQADRSMRLYRPGIYLRRIIDVFGLFFLLRFTEKPLRFFGLIGSVAGSSGALILLVLAVQRLDGQGLADRPLLLLGVLLVVLGIQAIALGLVGEIIVHLHASRRRPYRVIGERHPLESRGARATSFEARTAGHRSR